MKIHNGLRFKVLASVFSMLCLYQSAALLNAAGVVSLPFAAATTQVAVDVSDIPTTEKKETFKATFSSCKDRMSAIREAIEASRESGVRPALSAEDVKCAKLTRMLKTKQRPSAPQRTDGPAKRELQK